MRIFCDFDDTMVNTSDSFLECANKILGLNKTPDDIYSFNLTELDLRITKQVKDEIFESEELFSRLKMFDGVLDTLPMFDVWCCTIGSRENLKKKNEWLNKNNIQFKRGFIEYANGINKSVFDMSGCIQIDDNVRQLECTNASFKILFKNYREREYNRVDAQSNIYIVNSWNEINDILRWLYENQSYSTC